MKPIMGSLPVIFPARKSHPIVAAQAQLAPPTVTVFPADCDNRCADATLIFLQMSDPQYRPNIPRKDY